MLDAHEEFYGPNMGTVYLFGKVNMNQFDVLTFVLLFVLFLKSYDVASLIMPAYFIVDHCCDAG